MFKKIAWWVIWPINFPWVNKGEKHSNVLDESDVIKDNIKSLVSFVDYKEDIESFMYIDANTNKYNKNTKRLDLTKLIFWIVKSMLGDQFLNYISHPDFKNLILEIYWLNKIKWEYKINFNSELWKEEFIIINISDNRRYSWFLATEVDNFIVKKLDIKNNLEMDHFIKKVIYWINESFEKYTWEWFKQFIYSNIYLEVKKILLEKNNIEKLFLNWNNKTTDKQHFIEAMTWKIYRDNFDYINKIAWHKLMSDIPKLILDELLGNNNEELKSLINNNFNIVIDFILNFNSLEDDILSIENYLNNDILINFQDRLKLYFHKFDKTKIDSGLLKWAISFLIENNNLNLNIKELSDSIFSLLEDNIAELIILFWKYNWQIIEENWKRYKYSEFKIRDYKILEWKYSVEKVLEFIKWIIKELNDLMIDIDLLEKNLENSKIKKYKYKTNIWIKEKQLLEYDNEIDLLILKRKDISDELLSLSKSWILNKVLKNKLINDLENENNKLYEKLLIITRKREDLEVIILWSNDKVFHLNDTNIDNERKIEDLKLIFKNKNLILERIKDDFMRNVLFGREEIK